MKTQVVVKRPIMRYPGGKWVIAKKIIAHFPPHHVYAEPFAGAASVLLRKPRAKAEFINDLDGDVVNLFRVLRDPKQAKALEKMARLTPFARAEYYQAHERCDDPIERARRILVRSFMGHGSDSVHRRNGYRSKSLRRGCTPAWDWRNFPDHIQTFTERLRGVTIDNRPAVEMIAHLDTPGTLFYVDPPYMPDLQSVKYAHSLDDGGHKELLETLSAVKGAVVLSGYAHPLYEAMLPGWRRVEIPTFANGARPRTEVLWLSPNIPSTQLLNSYTEVQA